MVFTLDEMEKAETTNKILLSIPEDQRKQAVLMMNAFLLGIEAQENASPEPKAVNQ